ncbi:TetR/AcrR family transcriptional regulator [Saccharibacillus sp. CPCC 101409]|uniref:TetR/AcrR family transcriptional regulator n=1 Tax=Saccharibacillus sp. CPCC 101409 TaxID=3058041 RepID=UPI002671100B|nr:TetR/AcrR family transcriptional regulator [Saccharibacillus sp. CPCC 101409]MDO3412415.1 TetR/AcrR family transcriptional regulator [Saccharibacillus sp. CPCC 101409]
MSRPREFDADHALHQCMEVFWTKGYHATSYEDLTRTTQVKKQSLYGVFKSKRELFLKSLALYREQSIELLEERAAGKKSPVEKLQAICEAALFPDEAAVKRGCLMINASLEFDSGDEEINREVMLMTGTVEKILLRVIRSGQEQGEITTRMTDRELAAHLNNAIGGAKVLEKSGTPREQVSHILHTTIALMQA